MDVDLIFSCPNYWSYLFREMHGPDWSAKTPLHYAAQLRPGEDGATLCDALLARDGLAASHNAEEHPDGLQIAEHDVQRRSRRTRIGRRERATSRAAAEHATVAPAHKEGVRKGRLRQVDVRRLADAFKESCLVEAGKAVEGRVRARYRGRRLYAGCQAQDAP